MNVKMLVGGAIVASLAGLLVASSGSATTPTQTDSGTVVCTTNSNGFCPIVSLPFAPNAVTVEAQSPQQGTPNMPFQHVTHFVGNGFQTRFVSQTGTSDGNAVVTYSYIATSGVPVPTPSDSSGSTATTAPATGTPTPTDTGTVTPTPSPTTTTPAACGGPITISVGGTYSGCYQSNSTGTAAVTVSTTQPVTLDHAQVVAKGYGLIDGQAGVRLTVTNSKFTQQNPGAVVDHRAIALTKGAGAVDIEHNSFVDGDGIWISSPTSNAFTLNGVKVNYNYSQNVGRYPNPKDFGCCVQFLQFSEMTVPAAEVGWNHTLNVKGQSGVEDNINFWNSGGQPTSKTNVHNNLIDGAYPVTNDTSFTGGGINLGDQGSHDNFGHDNTVVSTTNYGMGLSSSNNTDLNNILINDGAEQTSVFGQAVTVFQNVVPAGVHSNGDRYNWHRSTTDTNQYPCYQSVYCGGQVLVTTTEQQARDAWDAARVTAGVTVGPNW